MYQRQRLGYNSFGMSTLGLIVSSACTLCIVACDRQCTFANSAAFTSAHEATLALECSHSLSHGCTLAAEHYSSNNKIAACRCSTSRYRRHNIRGSSFPALSVSYVICCLAVAAHLWASQLSVRTGALFKLESSQVTKAVNSKRC